MDVQILKDVCMSFRDIFIEETTIDPFSKSLTIAGFVEKILKNSYL